MTHEGMGPTTTRTYGHRPPRYQALGRRERAVTALVAHGPVGRLDRDACVRGGDVGRQQVVTDAAVEGDGSGITRQPLEGGPPLAVPEDMQSEVGIAHPLHRIDDGRKIVSAVQHAAGEQDPVFR